MDTPEISEAGDLDGVKDVGNRLKDMAVLTIMLSLVIDMKKHEEYDRKVIHDYIASRFNDAKFVGGAIDLIEQDVLDEIINKFGGYGEIKSVIDDLIIEREIVNQIPNKDKDATNFQIIEKFVSNIGSDTNITKIDLKAEYKKSLLTPEVAKILIERAYT